MTSRTTFIAAALLLASLSANAQMYSEQPNSPGAGRPVTHKALIKASEDGNDEVPKRLLGGIVTVQLKPNGKVKSQFIVAKNDGGIYTCKTMSAGFKGGKVTARFVGYDPAGDGDAGFYLDNCAAGN